MAPDPKCFVARAIIRAHVPGVLEDKDRWCVVLRVEHDRLEVAYGQGSRGSDQDICIDKDSWDNKRYKCKKTTYFRPTNIAFVPREDVIEFKGTASNEHYTTYLEWAANRSLAAAATTSTTTTAPPTATTATATSTRFRAAEAAAKYDASDGDGGNKPPESLRRDEQQNQQQLTRKPDDD